MWFLTIFLSLFVQSQASILQLQPGTTEIEKVKIANSAQLNSGKLQLDLVGAGIRRKKVAFIKADVYVAQFFVSDSQKFQKTKEGALNSLSDMKAAAISLTFLREVDEKKIIAAFEEGFKENNIAMNDAVVVAFVNAVRAGGGVNKDSTITVLAEKNGDKETITYEDAKGKSVQIAGVAGDAKKIFALWLGKMPDSGLEDLQKSILK